MRIMALFEAKEFYTQKFVIASGVSDLESLALCLQNFFKKVQQWACERDIRLNPWFTDSERVRGYGAFVRS